MRKRIFSALLMLCLLLNYCPAFAIDEQIPAVNETAEENIDNESVQENINIQGEDPADFTQNDADAKQQNRILEGICHYNRNWSEDSDYLSDEIYLVNGGQMPNSLLSNLSYEEMQIVMNLPENISVVEAWTGRGDHFDAKKTDAIYSEGGKTVFDLYSAIEKEIAGTHSYDGCFYIRLSNEKVYTLVVDDPRYASGSHVIPESVALYDISNKEDEEYPLGNQYIVKNSDYDDPEKESVIIGTVPASDSENGIQLAATVKNSTFGTGLTRAWSSAENWVVVNGEPQEHFTSSTDNQTVYSPAFTLQHGWNVVEVYSESNGFSLNNSSNWFEKYGSGTMRSSAVVYLLYYEGKTAQPPSKGSEAKLNTQTLAAYIDFKGNAGAEVKTAFNEIEADSGKLSLSVPSDYMNGPASADKGVLLMLQASDALATITLEGPEGLQQGEPIGCTYAINPCVLADLEEKKFVIKITSADGQNTAEYPVEVSFANSDTDSGIAFITEGTGLETLDGEPMDFDSGETSFCLKYDAEGKTAFNLTAPKSSSAIQIDGETVANPNKEQADPDAKNFTKCIDELSAEQDFHTITIVAEDKITSKTYYFVTKRENGEVPYFTISQDTKDQAAKLLQGYWDDTKDAQYFTGYWPIFMAVAAGSGVDDNGKMIPYDFTGKNVYDVTKHGNRQATDPAACILQLVMLGENPYNFNGINFVERMQNLGGGPYANNIWYIMAAKAVGIAPRFSSSVSEWGLTYDHDLDMRAWSIASLNNLEGFSKLDLVRYIDSLHDAQITETSKRSRDPENHAGLFQNNHTPGLSLTPNTFSNGCVISAIASAGVDPNRVFAYNGFGKTYYPLQQIENLLWEQSDGKFIGDLSGSESEYSYNKDMIIGLGDIINGSNVWDRYRLTKEKYENLIQKAKDKGVSVENMPTFGTDGYGKAYYDLYDAVFEKTQDRSMRPSVIWGMPYQLFEDQVNDLPETITESDLERVKEAVNAYEALDEDNLSGVSNKTESKYQNAVSAALQLKDKTAADIYKSIMALPQYGSYDPDQKDKILADIANIREIFTEDQKENVAWSGKSTLTKWEKWAAWAENLNKPSQPENPDNPGNSDDPDTPDNPGNTDNPSQPGNNTSREMVITFKLLGAPNDGENGTVHTLKNGNLDTWYECRQVFMSSSVSAEEAFRAIMKNAGIEWRGDSSGGFGSIYVRGIQNPKSGEWMEEFSTTSNSGWMYAVNGKHPEVGLSNYDLKDGDEFIVHFTDDYTQEKDSEKWSGSSSGNTQTESGGSSAGDAIISDKVTANSKGEATSTVTESTLKDAIAETKSSKGNSIIVAPSITGEATKVAVELPKDAVQEVVRQTSAEVRIETPVGQITISNDVLADILDAAKNSDLTFTMEKQTTEQGKAFMDRLPDTVTDAQKAGCVITEVTMASGKAAITSWGGKGIGLLLPVNEGFEEGKSYTVHQFSDDGKEETLTGKCIKQGKDLFVQVTVTHLSTFVVLPEAIAEEEEQTPTITLPFTDVADGDWFADAVKYVYANGLFSGTDETTFAPNDPMTRAMLVSVLWRMEGTPQAGQAAQFADVQEGEWYADAAAWASEEGIVAGTDAGFEPDGNVTREQITSILYRYAKTKGWDVTGNAALDSFVDAAGVSDWAARAMQWAYAEGLVTGKDGSRLDPQGQASRAEVAAILMRLIESQVKNDTSIP